MSVLFMAKQCVGHGAGGIIDCQQQMSATEYRPPSNGDSRPSTPDSNFNTSIHRIQLATVLVVCYQNQIVPTQEAPPRPGVLRTLNATRGLGSVTVENLAAGMDTNGIDGHEREGLGAMTAIGRGLAAGRSTTDRESEAVHPKAQPPRPPTPRQRARWKAVQRAKRRGLSLRAIARELGISRITVRKYVEASSPPVYPDRELAAHS